MNKYFTKILSLITAFIIFTSIIISASLLVLNFKSLYYFEIDALNIEASSGYDKNTIKENYSYTIDYLNDTSIKSYSPPSMNSSLDGKEHFSDVRNIFTKMKFFLIISIIITFLGLFILKFKNKLLYCIKTAYIMLISIPIIFSILISINFNNAFIMFHKLMFNNDKWLFDPNFDEIITILPEEFFLHCSIAVVSITIICGVLLMLLQKKFNKAYSNT